MNTATNFYQELLQDDWLGRTPDTYTFIKNGISMGWEQTLTKGSALSSFFMKVSGTPNMDKQLLLTKQACNNLFARMNFTKKPARIIFSKEFKSYRQGSTLCVTVEPLSKTNKDFPTFNHRLDPIMGYCIHEIAHFLYTTPEYHDYLMTLKGMEFRVKKEIMNILEDERIEQRVNSAFRGYTDYIGKAKDYAFDKKWEEEAGQAKLDTEDEMNQLFTQFLYLVRYPKALDETLVLKFETELRQIKNILTPYPENIPELTVASDKIYKVLEKYLNQSQTQSDQDDEDSSQEDDSQSGGSGQGQKGQPGGKGKGSPSGGSGGQSDEDSEAGDAQEGDSENGEGDGDDTQSDKGKGSGKSKGKGQPTDGDGEETEEDSDGSGKAGNKPKPAKKQNNNPLNATIEPITLEEALEALLDVYELVTATPEELGITPDDLAKILGRDVAGPVLEEINAFDNEETDSRTSYMGNYPETAGICPSELSVIFKNANDLKASQNNYDKALQPIKGSASSLRAKFQQLNRNQDLILRGLSEGDFDDSLLVDSLVGAKNVYMEQHRIQNRSAVIGLLIDESGSMDGQHIKHARQIAVLFERALTGVNNIDFYCYGHTTGAALGKGRNSYDSTHINVYFEGMKSSNRLNLGKIHAHNTNRDGHAIVEVIGRMRKTVAKEKPIILFMVSDGAPSASVPHKYQGDGRAYTKKCVEAVQRYDNAQIIHIAIEDGIDSASMFTNYIKFTNPMTLVNDIGNLLKKVMLKQQQAEIL